VMRLPYSSDGVVKRAGSIIIAFVCVGLIAACSNGAATRTTPASRSNRQPETPLPRPLERVAPTPLPPPATFTPAPAQNSKQSQTIPTVTAALVQNDGSGSAEPASPATTRSPAAFSMEGASGGVPATPPQSSLPTDYDAAQAITQYAANVLHVNVEVVVAGSKAGDVPVPQSVQESLDAAINVAGTTYAGLLQNGAASVSLGAGNISGNMDADIQDASLGAFSLLQAGAVPTNETDALVLVQVTFPGIADWPFVLQKASATNGPQPGQGRGKLVLPTLPGGGGLQPPPQAGEQTFVFSAQTQQNEVDVRSGQAKVVVAAALVGVSPGGVGKVNVFAVVGKGALASSLGK